ncbi:MAG: ComEC/Rec2 family competence protein [Chlamydiales bacterium]
MLFGIGLIHWKIDLPEQSKLPLNGSAVVHIDCIEKQDFFFGSGYVYKGIIRSFYSPLKSYSHIPCSIYAKKKSYIIDCDYLIIGELRDSKPFQYHLKPTKEISWEPISHTFSLAELRFQYKNFVQKFLKKKFSDKHIYSLISTLSTGNSPDLIIKHHFSRLGLSHLLVISGFHFSVLALLAKRILDIFFSQQITTILLLLLIASYGMYVGPQASSMRAGLIIYIYLLGRLLGRKCIPLNVLGCALFIQLLINPLLLFQIGFQLSYAATFGILLFFPSYKRKMEKLLPRRNRSHSNLFLKFHQAVIDLIRNQIALLFSSHVLLLPILLYYFSYFPILSFFYNLVIPILVSFCLITLPFVLIPGMTFVTQTIASFLWTLVMYTPESLNIEIYCPFISSTLLLMFLTLIFMYQLFDYNSQMNNLCLHRM